MPRQAILEQIQELDNKTAATIYYDWRFWARPGQTPPDWDWRAWVLKGGRGSGKTWTGANLVNEWAKTNEIILLVGRTAADVRDVMIEGESGILNVSPPWFMPSYEPGKRKVTWPNGAHALCFSADEPNALRGPQGYKAWADELAAWRKLKESWDNLSFGIRLGRSPQIVITTTPRPIKILKNILALSTTHVTTESTLANRYNLAEQWASEVISRYQGTRLGRQELEGDLLEDNPNALWKMETLDKYRVLKAPPALDEVVVAVDPPASDDEEAINEGKTALAGIIVGGRKGRKEDNRSHSYILEDASMHGRAEEWSAQAVSLYHKYKADKIVAEQNNGGSMVRAVIQAYDSNIPVELVTASRAKATRAEPVATLDEKGRVHHVQYFAELETELCEWVPGMKSPDRLDARVWCITSLMLGDFEITRPYSAAAR